MTEGMLTTADVAVKLGISRRQVQTLIERGQLPAVKIARDWFIKPADVHLVKDRPKGRRPKDGAKGAKPRRSAKATIKSKK